MRIEAEGDRWIIARGKGGRESYFSFFVDSDRSSWVIVATWNCRKFRTAEEAQEAIDELKRRARMRASARKQAT